MFCLCTLGISDCEELTATYNEIKKQFIKTVVEIGDPSLSSNAAVPPEESQAASAHQYSSKMSITAPNGTSMDYFHIPGLPRKFDPDMDPKLAYSYFKRRMPPSNFNTFVTECFGSIPLGISLLLDSLADLDEDGTMLRQVLLQKQLSTQTARSYSIDQALALKSHVPLTFRVCFYNSLLQLPFRVLHKLL